jgi:head-tail adaptor
MNIDGKTTNPGSLRVNVSLQTPTIVKDAGGAQVPGWATLTGGDVKCKWTNVHGSEVWQSQAVQAIEPATVLIRYFAALTTACTILKGSVRYKIVSIDNVQERNEYMEIKVQRVKGSIG